MSGALVGSGSLPPIRVGARNHCMHSMYRAGVPVLRPCYGNRSTLRRAPSQSGYPAVITDRVPVV